MWALLLALVGVLLVGLRFEGTVRMRGVLAVCAFVRVGRVRAFAFAYRPGRVYVRMGRC